MSEKQRKKRWWRSVAAVVSTVALGIGGVAVPQTAGAAELPTTAQGGGDKRSPGTTAGSFSFRNGEYTVDVEVVPNMQVSTGMGLPNLYLQGAGEQPSVATHEGSQASNDHFLPGLRVEDTASFGLRAGGGACEGLNFSGLCDVPLGKVTLKFPHTVTDPVLDISALGGYGMYYLRNPNLEHNDDFDVKGSYMAQVWDVETTGVSLSEPMTGATNLSVSPDGKAFSVPELRAMGVCDQTNPGYMETSTGYMGLDTRATAGCGSIRLQGTFDKVTFTVREQVQPIAFQHERAGVLPLQGWNKNVDWQPGTVETPQERDLIDVSRFSVRVSNDFGDAPSSYDSEGASAANHVVGGLRIGSDITPDAEEQSSPTVSPLSSGGADGDSDDGLGVVPTLQASLNRPESDSAPIAPYTVEVPVTGVSGGATLAGWLDLNKDGLFSEDERRSVNVSEDGIATLTWDAQASSAPGKIPCEGEAKPSESSETYLRLRLAHDAPDVETATGFASSGEVEDYRVPVERVDDRPREECPTPTVTVTETPTTVATETVTETPSQTVTVTATTTPTVTATEPVTTTEYTTSTETVPVTTTEITPVTAVETSVETETTTSTVPETTFVTSTETVPVTSTEITPVTTVETSVETETTTSTVPETTFVTSTETVPVTSTEITPVTTVETSVETETTTSTKQDTTVETVTETADTTVTLTPTVTADCGCEPTTVTETETAEPVTETETQTDTETVTETEVKTTTVTEPVLTTTTKTEKVTEPVPTTVHSTTTAEAPKRGTIGDRVWIDENGDGKEDPDEKTGIPNVPVVIVDKDGNEVTRTVTDKDGNWKVDVEPGEYTVRYEPGDRTPSDPELVERTIVIKPGEENFDVDLGILPSGSVGDRVWNDEDGDGEQGEDEKGLENVVVLVSREGEPTRSAVTDENGDWKIEGLNPNAEYDIRFIKPEGWDVTGKVPGSDESGLVSKVTVKPNEYNDSYDLGLQKVDPGCDCEPEEPGTIGDRVWVDENGDGKEDPNEKTGVPDVTVIVKDPEGNEITRTVTDENGNWKVDVKPGDYIIEYVPGEKTPSQPDQVERTVTIKPGEKRDDVDLGVHPKGSVGDRVWNDEDGDGKQDEDEKGLENVVVLVSREGEPTRSAVTDENGDWKIEGLNPNAEYDIRFIKPEGWEVTGKVPGSDESGLISKVTVKPNEYNDSYDLGLKKIDPDCDCEPVKPGTIGDRVWIDLNGNGKQDPNETEGAPDVTVIVRDADGNEVTRTVTDEDGNWKVNVEPGDYEIEYRPRDWKPTDPKRVTQKVTVEEGKEYLDLDLGVQKPKPGDPTPPTDTPAPDPEQGSSTETLDRCVANAVRSPLLYLVPVALLGAFGGEIARPYMGAINEQINQINAQFQEAMRRNTPDWGQGGRGGRDNDQFAELRGQIDAANRRIAELGQDPNVQRFGTVAAGIIGLIAAGGVLYDWCSNEKGEAFTSIGGSSSKDAA